MSLESSTLTSKMEDYLEAILALKEKNGVARVGEIAKSLAVKSSSVNTAINFLSSAGFVTHEKYGYVGLTKEGEKAANAVQKKHDVLYRFLTEFLMLAPSKAEKEACLIEHSISEETFSRLTDFFTFLEDGFKNEKPNFLKNFEHFIKTGKIKCNSK